MVTLNRVVTLLEKLNAFFHFQNLQLQRRQLIPLHSFIVIMVGKLKRTQHFIG